MISFNSAKHEYLDGDNIILSVTQILKNAGCIDERFFTIEGRERGEATHTLCERYANGERFDKKGRELASLEYVNAFANWMRDTMAYAITTECIVYHTLNGRRYAGRFDLLAEILRKRALIDIKTGAKAPWHKIQLAAYGLAAFKDGSRVNPDRMSCLYLKPNGKYSEDRMTGPQLIENISKWKDALAGGKTDALIEREFKQAARAIVRDVSFYAD